MYTSSAGVLPAVRHPTFMVNVNGAPCGGFLSFDVTNNTHFSSDTFSLVAAISALPADRGPAWWDSVGHAVTVEIWSDETGQGNFASLIMGEVDVVEMDWVDMTMTLSGRDFSAQLIDTKSNVRVEGRTASDIVHIIAERHGLTPNVRSTAMPSGRFYEQEHARITQEQSEWELLVYLAQEEGFDLWVSGTTLNFQPPVDLTSTPYRVWRNNDNSANALRLTTARTLPLGRPVTVKLSTWNQSQEVAISHAFQAVPSVGAVSGPSQDYAFVMPNLEPARLVQWAQNRLEEITEQERQVMVELPGDNSLSVRTIVQLAGTNTGADQLYRVASIQRSFSFSAGYLMTLRLKNHSPQTITVIA